MTSWTSHLTALQPLSPAIFQGHLQRLGEAARADRFGNHVSDAFLTDYARRTPRMGTHVIGCLVDGDLRAAVEIRLFDPATRACAEAAFSVEEPWQSQGVGTALMITAIGYAHAAGIGQLLLCCSARNIRMQRIARRAGARVHCDTGECTATIDVLQDGTRTAA
jgi:GNAT superfamily N-acetyltransferase